MKQNEITTWLVIRVATMLERDAAEIDPTASFTDLGLSSLQAVELTGDLEENTGVPVSPTAVYDHPTIEALGAEISESL